MNYMYVVHYVLIKDVCHLPESRLSDSHAPHMERADQKPLTREDGCVYDKIIFSCCTINEVSSKGLRLSDS